MILLIVVNVDGVGTSVCVEECCFFLVESHPVVSSGEGVWWWVVGYGGREDRDDVDERGGGGCFDGGSCDSDNGLGFLRYRHA